MLAHPTEGGHKDKSDNRKRRHDGVDKALQSPPKKAKTSAEHVSAEHVVDLTAEEDQSQSLGRIVTETEHDPVAD